MISHRHAVVRERPGAQCATLPHLDAIGLEDALLERVRPKYRERIEVRVVADIEQRVLGPTNSIIEYHLAHLDALETRENVLEGSSREPGRDLRQPEQMPVPLVEPVIFVQHQGDLRRQPAEAQAGPFYEPAPKNSEKEREGRKGGDRRHAVT